MYLFQWSFFAAYLISLPDSDDVVTKYVADYKMAMVEEYFAQLEVAKAKPSIIEALHSEDDVRYAITLLDSGGKLVEKL